MMITEHHPDDLFLRQVHPSHAPDGTPSSQAFNPTPKDDGKLSVDDAKAVNAKESWTHFTANLGFESAGTWAVSLGEIEESGDLVLQSDPVHDSDNPTVNNPAHCLIDFNGVKSKGQRKRRAQKLAIKASARGCLFKP